MVLHSFFFRHSSLWLSILNSKHATWKFFLNIPGLDSENDAGVSLVSFQLLLFLGLCQCCWQDGKLKDFLVEFIGTDCNDNVAICCDSSFLVLT